MFAVGRIKHNIPGSGVIIPTPVGLNVHRTEFPLTKWIINALGKSLLLFFHSHFQPELQEQNARVNNIFLELGTKTIESLQVLLARKTHDLLDASPVVPTAIKYDNFARSRKLLDITLHEQL